MAAAPKKPASSPAGHPAGEGHDHPADPPADTPPTEPPAEPAADTPPADPPADEPPASDPTPEPAADGKPSVHVPMAWTAIGIQGGSPTGTFYVHGVPVTFPPVNAVLSDLGAKADHNTIVLARPRQLAESLANGICAGWVKVAGGKKLPDLVLYPDGDGRNWKRWCDYLARHKPTSLALSPTDWNPSNTIRV